MKRIKNHNTYMKLIFFGLIVTLSLVLFTGCGTKSDDTKDNGTTGITQEEPKTDEDKAPDTTGQKDNETNDGTYSDGTGDEASSTNQGDGTSGDGSGGTNTPTTPTTPATPASTCTIQINCKLLVGKDLSGTSLETLVPADGIILGTTKVTLNPGDTVYDVTLRVTKAKRIHMSTQGSQAMENLYIEGISNIYEQDYNMKSGWVYLINGAKPGIGCSVKELKSGDALVWAYSLDYGNDL